MAGSVNDIGTAGEPMSAPPLTWWQQAVVNIMGGLDTPLSQRFLALTGGTVTGTLNVAGDVTADWVQARYGADMAGNRITWIGDPEAVEDAANKQYVDSRIWFGTQVQYDQIAVKDMTVLYVVTF